MIIESAYVTGSLDLIPLSQNNTESKVLVIDNDGRVKYKETQNITYNPVSRYVSGTSGSTLTVYASSISDLHTNIPWQRTGSILALTHSNHNLQVDDLVVIRNTYTDFTTGSITEITTNTFTVNVGGDQDPLITGSLGIYSGAYRTIVTAPANTSRSFSVIPPSNSGSSYIKLKELTVNLSSGTDIRNWIFNVSSSTTFNSEENTSYNNYIHPIVSVYKNAGTNDNLLIPIQSIPINSSTYLIRHDGNNSFENFEIVFNSSLFTRKIKLLYL